MNQSYGRLVSRAAIAATAMASLLLLIKIFAWWYTGSVSILAALVDSLVDIGASLTNLLVVRYSLQPADDNHSFGHGKAESLAALAQSMFISGSALFLFLTGIQHLISPTPMTDLRQHCRDDLPLLRRRFTRDAPETGCLLSGETTPQNGSVNLWLSRQLNA